ncbi:5'-nucleotidase domain-containing protein 1 isoform X1 [Tribolium madens]|uniref:5'-nucleotidase domain-containing protein 1 isoform X1 n=2 Tax=Tribolium madens TaxID=41895 RepID=UPI001CF75CFB|nr:5'-nucleotidase domain-containing protein 1 isoform X1 [Tribolium madens]
MTILGGRSHIVNTIFRIWSSGNRKLSHNHNILGLPYTNKKSFIYLRKSERYISTMFSEKSKSLNGFKFTDYDCIGFDLDNTLSRYKVGAMIEMEYNIMAKFLVEKKGYSKKHLLKPFDHNFILRGLIVDDENGNILRIAADGYILQAAHGTKMLQDDEIEKYYPKRHWEISDLFVQDPLTTWNGPYSEKMRTLLDYFDIASSLIFARAIDDVDEQKGQKTGKYEVWLDIQAALQDMFNRDNFQTGTGFYFEEMKAHPEKYYHKCSNELLDWLKLLKKQKKSLFLLTGSHVDFASHTATNTVGPNWRDYFDIVVCFAKKPGFFTMRRDFLKLDGVHEGPVVKLDQLQIGGMYTHGNWTDLHKFLTKHLHKEGPKFLYIGDNLVQDIYTPHIHSHCDTVTVCEELEAEGVQGYHEQHPDQHYLVSTFWGSYFTCNKVDTNWSYLMKKHSKLCVPSLEYVASLPIEHEYQANV